MLGDSVLVSTAYLPPVSYLNIVANSSAIIVEADENYKKQTIRNRCFILGANGIQCLSVPVQSGPLLKTKIRDLKINYHTSWQQNHIRSIMSAYGNAPYFLYYADELFSLLNKSFKYLIDLNYELLNWSLKIILSGENKSNQVLFKLEYFESIEPYISDKRILSDKKKPDNGEAKGKKYEQVFSDRWGFVNDLSALDLIFNEGSRSRNYLTAG